MNSTLKWILVALSAITIGGAAVAAYGALNQQATNTNTGDVPEAELFTYAIGATPYIDGSPISWGTLTRGPTTVTFSITNLLTATPITISILNSTMPEGFTLTAVTNGTVIAGGATATIAVTITVAETVPAGSYTWDTSVFATT